MNSINQNRLPAEWESQEAVIIVWPSLNHDWQENIKDADVVYREIALKISRHQKLVIVLQKIHYGVFDPSELWRLFSFLVKHRHNVEFFVCDTNDTWVRDFGPISVNKAGSRLFLNFNFNAWGGKYPYTLDNDFTGNFLSNSLLFSEANEKQSASKNINVVLEGGAIDSNGNGLVLATEESILNANRGGLSKAEIDHLFLENFGTKEVLWLSRGFLIGDDTDGHIDMLARFIREDLILYLSCSDKKDNHYGELLEMEAQLKEHASTHSIKLQPLPLPTAVVNSSGERLPATYLNFLICNEVILVPVYGVKEDKSALSIISKFSGNRQVIGIDSRALIEQGGAIHCSTMQVHS